MCFVGPVPKPALDLAVKAVVENLPPSLSHLFLLWLLTSPWPPPGGHHEESFIGMLSE